jgi:hypothetical protein
MSPRGFGYVMTSGFVAWLISTLLFITIQPDDPSLIGYSIAVLVMPLLVTKIAHVLFRHH